MDEIEKIQSEIIKRICEQKVTTPYYGIISELGIWPVNKHIEYKRIMLLHSVLSTKEERTLKEIIEDQVNNTWKGCWMEQTKEICQEYNINITNITEYTKDKLKQVVKGKIKESLKEEIQKLAKEKTKLRFLKNFDQENYIEELQFEDSIEMLKIRLNMIETKSNYKGTFKTEFICELCKETEDTTEHLLDCKITTVGITTNKEDIMLPNYKVIDDIRKVIKRRENWGIK